MMITHLFFDFLIFFAKKVNACVESIFVSRSCFQISMSKKIEMIIRNKPQKIKNCTQVVEFSKVISKQLISTMIIHVCISIRIFASTTLSLNSSQVLDLA